MVRRGKQPTALLGPFGSSCDPACIGDLDANRDVELTDLTTLLANFGTTCP
ncbi:MAG: hypothetical protein HZB38_05270 [Planctomycetes bacterium]|nr:hypothetical protein [Planctomycetota bacterium]